MRLNQYIEILEDIYTRDKYIHLSILRIDKLHPIISGNKYFKLKYFLEEAIRGGKSTIATFGGYYSNHLHATAYACKEKGLQSIGYIKGHQPKELNDTLKDCIKYGMKLEFIPHQQFDQFQKTLIRDLPENILKVPMGGFDPMGIAGASEILDIDDIHLYDYIVAAAGTGTMAAGLLLKLKSNQQLILFSSLKNEDSLQQDIFNLNNQLIEKKDQVKIIFDLQYGAYGKANESLYEGMNWFYDQHGIPTDFVYTGKLVNGFYELLKTGYFKPGSKILLIHSGGLQGNRSIQSGKLNFQ